MQHDNASPGLSVPAVTVKYKATIIKIKISLFYR